MVLQCQVRFINFERTELPNEIFRHNVEEKKKYLAEIQLDVEKSDAEIQVYGPYFIICLYMSRVVYADFISVSLWRYCSHHHIMTKFCWENHSQNSISKPIN